MSGNTNIDVKIIEMLNTIREAGTLSYQNAVPILQEGDVLQTYGATILGQPVIRNEFLNAFTNFFMYEVTKAHIFESEFDRLKNIGSPLRYGTFESFTNTIKPMQYKIDELDRILKLYTPDVKTAYFTRTREDIFPMSVALEKLQGAFMSFEAFNGFINELYSTIVRSNKTVEYNAIKECINVNTLGGGFKVVKIPKITEANAKTIAKMIRSYFHKMQKPSTQYNNYINLEGAEGDPVETNTPEEALLIITDADTEAEIGIDVLASLYNLRYGNTSMYENNHITVDEFGYNIYDRENRTIKEHKDSNIRFMICDEAVFKITDDLNMEMSGYNDAALVRQNFYHIWQSINMRPWANCVVFVEEDEEPVDEITLEHTSRALNNGTASTTYTPTTAKIVTKFLDGTLNDENITEEDLNGAVTFIAENGTLTINFDESKVENNGRYVLHYDVNNIRFTISCYVPTANITIPTSDRKLTLNAETTTGTINYTPVDVTPEFTLKSAMLYNSADGKISKATNDEKEALELSAENGVITVTYDESLLSADFAYTYEVYANNITLIIIVNLVKE